MEVSSTEEIPLEYSVFALSFKEPGAIKFFEENLPSQAVGLIHGNTGLNEFYEALLDFYRKTGLDIIDPIAFKSWLNTETEIYDALGGPGGVQVFMDLVMDVDTSTPESVAKVLRHRANKRKQMDFLQELQVILAKKGHKSDQEIQQISDLTEQIRVLEQDLDIDPFQSVTTADDIATRIDQLMNLPDFLSTPYKKLNEAMGYTEEGGFFRGAVHAIIAASGKGKSTFAKCLCNHWADMGYTTLYINFEEAQAHWETVLFSQIIGENVYAKADSWTPEEKKERSDIFKARLGSWGKRFMAKHDPDTSYFSDLELWLRDIMGHNEIVPDVVVIDTLQSLIEKGKGARWAEFEYMMIRLEKLARDMDAVFIITAQQNADAMKEKRDVVRQSDTGGSITIQQKSSVCIFITPKKIASSEDIADNSIMELQITKNRITGATYENDPPLVLYSDESKSYLDFAGLDDINYNALELDDIGFGDFNL